MYGHKMRAVIAGILIALLGLASAPAFSADRIANWTNPTTRVPVPPATVGDPLPVSELRGTRIEYSLCSAPDTFGAKLGEAFAAAGATSYQLTGLPIGSVCFRAYARAVDRANPSVILESVASNVASAAIPDSPPGAPVMVSIASTAYLIQQRKDRIVLLAVGDVPAGVRCDGTQPVLGYFVVPRDAVRWYGTVRSEVVVAQCIA